MKIRTAIKGIGTAIGWSIVGLLILCAISFVWFLAVYGTLWISTRVLPWLGTISGISFAITLIILLPLSAIRRTRAAAGVLIMFASLPLGVTLWIWSFILAYALWGIFGLIIGLAITGVGVIPIAILAALFSGIWGAFGSLMLLLCITIAMPVYGAYMISKSEKERHDEKIESFYEDLSETG